MGGKVYAAGDADEAVRVINEIIGEKAKGKTCCAPILLPEGGAERRDVSLLIQTDLPFQGSNEKLLGEIDGGVTRADYATAKTGCVLERECDDARRLVS